MSATRVRNFLRAVVVFLAAGVLSLMANGYALAQNTFGTLSNFDVFNDTGQETHGFEIELDGLASPDVTYKFGSTYERYSDPQVVPIAGGVIVRYESAYDKVNKVFFQSTLKAQTPITPTGGHACWTGGVPPAGAPPYATAGCEHFGVGLARNPTATAYRWLVEDPANPGTLIASTTKVTVPAPVMNVSPPVVPGGQPVVQAIVPAEPPEVQEFGDAQWVKVYKTESPDPADLNHLVTDDPAAPDPLNPAEVETEWSLLQFDSNAGGGARKEQENHGDLGVGNESVTRRYEFYKFAGSYDAQTHEALPVSDASPVPGDIGDYEGAQIAAVNVVTPTATATATPTPLPGQLAAVPAKINFGNAVYGGLDVQGQVITKLGTIINKNKTLPAPIDPEATGDFTITDGGANGCTRQLAAKGKCTVGVKFQPSDFGLRKGFLTIGGIQVATLSGNGIHGKIAVPGSLNLGKTKAGTSATAMMTLTNKSPVPIEVSDIEIINDMSDFTVDQKCVGALTQTPCKITVTFKPSTVGVKKGKLKITDAAAGSPHMVNLIGTGS